MQRDPFAREVLAELRPLPSRPGAVSWELRGMAYRAGLQG